MKISACYIVKDEVDELRRSLSSIAPAADEIAVVSTAGDARVAAVAAEFHAGLYEFPWRNDFAAARNFALAHISGDYIIFLDADEYFLHPAQVRAAIESYAARTPAWDLLMVRMEHYVSPGDRNHMMTDILPRVLRGGDALCYEGTIHEQAVRRDGAERILCYADDRVACGHTGYMTERSAEKVHRNIAMLEADAAAHGRKPWHAAYLADCYFWMKDYRRVIELSAEVLSSDIVIIGGRSKIYHQVIESMRALHSSDAEMLKYVNAAIAGYPDLPDFYAERGMVLCGLGQYEPALASFTAAMDRYEGEVGIRRDDSFFNRDVAARIAERMSQIYTHLGDAPSAELWAEKERNYRAEEESSVLDAQPHMRLTACYIVRDDAIHLKKSIESLRAHVDELIVVDTGSADGSADTAAALGARVYHFAWNDNFAAARNAALSHVRGDWVVFLDADEYFTSETAGNLRDVAHAAEASGAQVLLVPWKNIDEDTGELLLDSFAPRMFKYAEERRYVGRIHEELRDRGAVIKDVVTLSAAQLKLIHTGYSATLTRAKGERNLRMLLAELETGDDPARCLRYLAETYDRLGDARMAEYYALRDIARGRQPAVYASSSYRILLHIYGMHPQMRDRRREIAGRAAADFPELPEMHAEYAEACAACYDYAAAIRAAGTALNTPMPQGGLDPSDFMQEGAALLRRRMEFWQKIYAHERDVRISACVFVRNDARDMKAWLENAAAYADERIVLDTGSSDGTRELAVRAGADVHDFVWTDDFAAARNAALAHASSTWAAVLDADEGFFDPGEVRPYLAMMDVLMPEADAVLLPIVHVDEDDGNHEIGRAPHVRLVRLDRGLFYEGRVHERLQKAGGEPVFYQETVALPIRHVGYSAGRMYEKHVRNLALLAAEIEQNGIRPGDYRYLADTYYGLGQCAAALLYAREGLAEHAVSLGAQSHLYHVLLDCMEREETKLADQIAAAERACRAFPLLPDFHGRLGLLYEAAGDGRTLAELTRASKLYEMPEDESGESSEFMAWAGEISAARARLLLAVGDRAGAEAALADAFDAGTAREAAVDVYAELHEDESPQRVLAGLRAQIGTEAERLFYLYRTAEGSGRMPLARAALDALRAETGRAPELPQIYAAARGRSPEECAAYLTGLLAVDVRETAEILLRVERVHTLDGRHLYRRLRALLPDVLRAFWRYYDEPDAAACPDTAEGYELVREAFVRTADEAQAARVIRCAGAFGIAHVRRLADDFAAAGRHAAALDALLFCGEAGGAADAAYLYETGRACLALGKRDEGRAYLSHALAAQPNNRKARELMELIR
ncbi:glycosyltransferase [uncultured Selenomonas sp.]|uniref:glycosyltransferase n=1 Tax=uncultured Selenomonas sp. TaxID=159275 RepID=UPI0028065576|nr:glycosyltransferase [uncultured Selenomonas sp.]